MNIPTKINYKSTIYIFIILLLLWLLGLENWINLAVILVSILMLILIRSERVIVLLAVVLVLMLPLIYWWDKDAAVWVGNAIFILLLYYYFWNSFNQVDLSINLVWDKYISYLYLLALTVMIIISGWSIYQATQRPTDKMMIDTNNLSINIYDTPKIDNDFTFNIDARQNIGQVLVSLKKPDNKWVSFEQNINDTNGSIIIYGEVIDQAGLYQLVVNNLDLTAGDYFEVE
ncbi:MAG: hypothetical protein WC570_04605 [Patescibacteria group bacterium]